MCNGKEKLDNRSIADVRDVCTMYNIIFTLQNKPFCATAYWFPGVNPVRPDIDGTHLHLVYHKTQMGLELLLVLQRLMAWVLSCEGPLFESSGKTRFRGFIEAE
jgi:hypothetical protein